MEELTAAPLITPAPPSAVAELAAELVSAVAMSAPQAWRPELRSELADELERLRRLASELAELDALDAELALLSALRRLGLAPLDPPAPAAATAPLRSGSGPPTSRLRRRRRRAAALAAAPVSPRRPARKGAGHGRFRRHHDRGVAPSP